MIPQLIRFISLLLPDEFLMTAAEEGNRDKCFSLIQTGANPNCQRERNSPLLQATEHGHLGVVKLLTECGVSLESLGQLRKRPLNVAIQHGRLNVSTT